MLLHKTEQSLKPPVKILIADDDTSTRLMLRAAISQWGFEVIEASNGEEAFKILLEPDNPQILILDWIMPKLDGIELCKKIRTQIASHPYIILLTQNIGTPNIIIGLDAGADEFLGKPFKMAELRSRLTVATRILTYKTFYESGVLTLNKDEKEIIINSVRELEALLERLDTDFNIISLKEKLEKIINSLKFIHKFEK